MKDIGIFASLDPVAIDAACLDAVRNSDDPGRDTLLERITSRHGEKIIDDAAVSYTHLSTNDARFHLSSWLHSSNGQDAGATWP